MAEDNPMQDAAGGLDIRQIMAILPHRYPFLLIDRILESSRKKRIVAIKNVTINEPFFQGHFPEHENKLLVFSGIDRARFRKAVTPGDQLRIEVDVLNWRPLAARLEGKVYVEGKLVCEATIMCAVVPRPSRAAGEAPVSQSGPTPAGAGPAVDPVIEPSLEPV